MKALKNLVESSSKSLIECYLKAAVVFEPPPDLLVSEWADSFRQLSQEASAEPGQWYTARAEYQRGIMDALCDPTVETVVIMSSAQVGKTEMVLNVIGYYISQDPAPMLCLQPTLDMASAFSKDRVAPMVRDTPALGGKILPSRSRDSGNTVFHKQFPGGHLTMAGANSPASLASRPVRIVLCDEVDRYPASAGTEGDPVNLARKRATTFWNRKILLTSTPTIKGASRIETAYEASDKRRYFVPCPLCGLYQALKWGGRDEAYGLKWDKKLKSVRYQCESCGRMIEERHKMRMISKGEWRATGKAGNTAGFHLNELYSPWSSWLDIVESFLAAKGSPETLQVWNNTVLGQTFEDRGEGLAAHKLLDRQEPYGDTIPGGVIYITAGCDVQGDRIEMEIVGWGIGEESWSLDYLVLNGDPGHHAVWDMLDAERNRAFDHPVFGKIGLNVLFVDSGFMTDTVQRYTKARKNVFSCQGQSSPNAVPKPIVPPRQRRTKHGLFVPVGADAAKDLIYSRLMFTKPGPGYCHFPDHYPPEYFDGLTAEQKKTKLLNQRPVKYWFLPKNARNEPLDCRVYALAALRFTAVNLQRIKDNRLRAIEVARKAAGKRKAVRPVKTKLW
jgi:phage terminase large subunit GpA-like protein